MLTEKLNNAKITYLTAEERSPITLSDNVLAWKDCLNRGFFIHIELDQPYFIEHIEFSATDIRGGKLYDSNGDLIAVTEDFSKGIAVNRTLQTADLLVETCYKKVVISDFAIYRTLHSVYPEPDLITMKEGVFPLKNAGVSGSDECAHAVALFRDGSGLGEGAGITFQLDPSLAAEEYVIDAQPTTVTVRSGGSLGAMYGADTLLQLITDGVIPCVHIEDKPYFKLRGFHMALPRFKNIDFCKKFIRHVLIPMRYNMVFIQVTACMEYKCYPQINELWLKACARYNEGKGAIPAHYGMLSEDIYTKEQVQELVAYIRSFGLEVVPEVQSLSHVQYLTRAFPEIGERAPQTFTNDSVDIASDDERPEDQTIHSFCPSNEKSYEVLFPVLDEVMEAFAPLNYIHIGHDEVYEIGLCEKCSQRDRGELFADDVLKIYRHIKEKCPSVTVMMWSDMLQDVSKYGTWGARDILPKDIICLDFIWYFHLDKDIETSLVSAGFPVMIGNLNSSHYPRFEQRRRVMIGGQTSAWTDMSEFGLVEHGRLFEAFYVGEMMWSENYRESMREYYSLRIADKMEEFKRLVHNDPGCKKRIEVALPAGKQSRAARKLGLDLDVPVFDADGPVAVGEKANVVVFRHTTYDDAIIPSLGEHLTEIGSYTVTYKSGKTEVIPVVYGLNIRKANIRYATPLKEIYYRHAGYCGYYYCYPAIRSFTKEGEPLTVYDYKWFNPHPDDTIVSITKRDVNADKPVLLLNITIEQG